MNITKSKADANEIAEQLSQLKSDKDRALIKGIITGMAMARETESEKK